jgi:hypothetical protein
MITRAPLALKARVPFVTRAKGVNARFVSARAEPESSGAPAEPEKPKASDVVETTAEPVQEASTATETVPVEKTAKDEGSKSGVRIRIVTRFSRQSTCGVPGMLLVVTTLCKHELKDDIRAPCLTEFSRCTCCWHVLVSLPGISRTSDACMEAGAKVIVAIPLHSETSGFIYGAQLIVP